ncbi:hypothetical protein N7925_00260 [Streptomyces sp. CA-278952]|uniref:hypothetical protein n=1 Tax=unclassified Streptomyces TaxID=2593676 RepID=UPI00236865CD|nr:hypothetical protein [Streptomyces sp. CA-278952]WDG26871.1 hypothetical protein N7925_00260 [Streptomyces sp. CA-278952]
MGAGLTALGGVYGPLRLHRRQSLKQESEKLALWREAETARLLLIRVTSRAWLDALDRAVQELDACRPTDLERFDEETVRLGQEAYKAGIDLRDDSFELPRELSAPPRGAGEADVLAAGTRSRLLGHLRESNRLIRAELLRHSVGEGTLMHTVDPEVRATLERTREARAAVNSLLRARHGELNGDAQGVLEW